VLAALTVIALTAAPVEAAHPALPSRPTTYPVDTRLSEGPVEGFMELSADPYSLAKKLTPVRTLRLPKVKLAPKVLVTQEEIVINDAIFFELDSDVIDAESHALLDLVATTMAENAEILTLQVAGHTDSQGDDAHNLDLSERRAGSVKAYLVGKGVNIERLNAKGFGETDLLEKADTEDAHATNRRVEFVIETWEAETLTAFESGAREVQGAANAKELFTDERRAAAEAAVAKTGSLPVVNTTSGWARITVGDIEIGVIGPLTNAVIKDVPSGIYKVDWENSTGYKWTTNARTIQWAGPLIPGGKPAQVSVDEGVVPSWHDDPTQGYVGPTTKTKKGRR